jgi:putative hydrolase of the HAD superfamily
MNIDGRCYLEPIVKAGLSSPAAVVFDGDDTLWSTEHLYDRARDHARELVAMAGLDADKWEKLERKIDVENVRHLGFSPERFPTSCVQAYEAVARDRSVEPDPRVRERVRLAASAVFRQDPQPIDGAKETLENLRARGVKLALLTKGDPGLQQRRVDRSGLANLFDVIHVVTDKPAAAFRDIVAELDVDPSETWSVGNSVRSDILPALEAGLRAVWIDAHVWEHERFDGALTDERVVVVNDLSRVGHAIQLALMDGQSRA